MTSTRFWQHCKLFVLSLLMVVIGFACLPQPSQPPLQAQTPSPTPPPLPGLPANPVGYVAMMRHAIAPGTGDPINFRLGDCQTQRNLSEAGRQQARQLGQQLRDRQVPVTRVLSSQWCRCLETAKLLDLGQVEPFPVLNSFFQDNRTETAQTQALRRFIVENRTTPGLIMMVTHQVNITALTGIFPQSGEMILVKASEAGQINVVGRFLNE